MQAYREETLYDYEVFREFFLGCFEVFSARYPGIPVTKDGYYEPMVVTGGKVDAKGVCLLGMVGMALKPDGEPACATRHEVLLGLTPPESLALEAGFCGWGYVGDHQELLSIGRKLRSWLVTA